MDDAPTTYLIEVVVAVEVVVWKVGWKRFASGRQPENEETV
jgi:hypothetical protein